MAASFDPCAPDHALRAAEFEFAALAVRGASGVRPSLVRLTELAGRLIPAAEGVSILLGPPDDPRLVASSSPAAQAADGAQLEAGAGPTADAIQHARAAVVSDLHRDPRWPGLGRHLSGRGTGVRSCVAVPLWPPPASAGGPVGALTAYGPEAGSLCTDEAGWQARRMAARAGGLVDAGERLRSLEEVRHNLEEALHSRAVIDQAKGMIMRERRCSAEEAFVILRRASNQTNRKLREIAHEIVARASGTAGPDG